MIIRILTLGITCSLVTFSGTKENASIADLAHVSIRPPFQDGLKHIKPKVGLSFEYNPEAEKESIRLQTLQKKIDKGEIKYENLPESEQLALDDLGQTGGYWSVGVSPVPQWIDEFPPSKLWASSTLTASKNANYDVANLMDYDLRTVWSEGASGNGIGEFVAIQFPGKNKFGRETILTSVTLLNGFVKRNDLWSKNGRVKSIKLYLNDKPFAFLDVDDSRAYQTFNLGRISSASGFTLKFEIAEIYPGTVYEDVVLSYLDFDGDGVL